MKITEIQFVPLKLEIEGDSSALGFDSSSTENSYASAETLAKQRFAPPETVFVRILTDDKLEGYGDGATLPHYLGHGVGSLLDWLKRFRKVLIGCDPLNIASIHRQMEAVASIGVPGCRPAQAAIDMAVYDLIGKAHGCPVYEILGGARRHELELQTQMHGHSIDQLLDVCNYFLNKGFTGLKLKIGGKLRRQGYSKGSIDEEVDKIIGVTSKLPDTVQIDVDANQALGNSKITIGIFEQILRTISHPKLSIEQPLHHLDILGHAFIRRRIPLPMVLDEAVTSPEAMMQIVRLQAADRVVLKPNRVGGLWQALKIVNICEANGIGVSLDTMPFTLLGDTMLCHLGSIIKNHYPLDGEGHTFFSQSPFVGGIKLQNGRGILSSEPGFGIQINEEVLSRMTASTEQYY